MTRDYTDGKIDEYISLGRYKLPPDRVGALIKDSDGQLLEDLEPEIQ